MARSRPFSYTLLYRVIVTVRQQFTDSFPHYITQERNGKSSKYKTLEHRKAYGDRHSAPTLSVKCYRISTLTLYTKVEMVTPMPLIYKIVFPSISTFETPPTRGAVVALARRLAGMLYALWRDSTVYDEARVGPRRRGGVVTV